jgi:hypothetical protein
MAKKRLTPRLSPAGSRPGGRLPAPLIAATVSFQKAHRQNPNELEGYSRTGQPFPVTRRRATIFPRKREPGSLQEMGLPWLRAPPEVARTRRVTFCAEQTLPLDLKESFGKKERFA